MSTTKQRHRTQSWVTMRKRIVALTVSIILALIAAGVFTIVDGYTKSARTKVELQNTYRQLQVKQAELEKNKLDSVENQKKIEELTKQLQAKKEAATVLAESARVTPVQAPRAYSGSHADWMSAAGIPSDQWAATEALVQRESSWNPNAYNSIGACSLVQALPCSKIPGDWRDPVTALRWGNGYVVARYGSWNNALAHSYSHNWY